METNEFELVEVDIRPKKLLDAKQKKILGIQSPTLYEHYQNCQRDWS